MTNEECKKIAKRIVYFEQKLRNTIDLNEKQLIEQEIINICEGFTDIVDMMQIDEEVQNILKNS